MTIKGVHKKIEIYKITSLLEMEQLKSDWNRVLYSYSNSTPFQSWEWNYGIVKNQNSSESLSIVTGKNSKGEIIGIAPFKLRKYLISNIKILEFIGTGISDYLDIIVIEEFKEIFVKELFTWLENNKEWHIINFISIRNESVELFSKYLQFEISNHIICPYILLPGTFEDFTKQISQKLNKYLKRNLNRLTSEGRLSYSILKSSDNIDKDINKFFELHQKRQNKKGERGHFHNKTMRKQFLEISTLLFNANLLKVGILKIESKFAAIHFNLIFRDKEYVYLPSMEPKLEKLSPSSLLYYLMIEDSIKNGKTIFDFTQGAESYKYRWTKDSVQLYKAFFFKTKFFAIFWKITQKILYKLYNSNSLKVVYQFTWGKIKQFKLSQKLYKCNKLIHKTIKFFLLVLYLLYYFIY